MTANVVHPAELERMLEARVTETRSRRNAAQRSRAGTGRRRARRGSVAMMAAAMLALSAAAVWASHGESFIDLTADNSIVNHDGAVYGQGGVGAGTGTFDPFLTLSESPTSPAEQAGTQDGYNQCDDAGCPDERGDAPFYYDQFFGGGRTHEILVSAIPTLEYPAGSGNFYREFSLDANDEGNDTWMSVDEIKLFTDTQVGLTGYNNTTESFSNDSGVAADLIFDMDAGGDQSILMVSQGLESGSGVSDITVLVPVSAFPDECYYGAPTGAGGCNEYLYFWTMMGHTPDGNHSGVTCTQNPCEWNVSAGFEEWRIRFLPVVNVTKTANETFDRDYDWIVDKTVTPTTLDLFDGDSDDVTWTVTPTRLAPEDSGFAVDGTITITNPTGAQPIPEDITATINSVEDVLEIDGVDMDVIVDCGVSFPYDLDAGETLVCTYSKATPDAEADSTGLNTATVEIESGIPEGDGGIEFGDVVSYEGTASVDFSGATPNVTDDTATLTDDRGPLDQAAQSGVPVPYDETFECGDDEGTYVNTAVVTEDDSGDWDDDDASVTVNCYQLTVAKTVDESLTRTWAWDLEKEADVSTIELFAGDSATIEWTVTLVSEGSTDDEWHVEGVITVSNPAPMIAEDVVVSDVISGFAGTITIDCGDGTATTDVPAAVGAVAGTATCDYEADLPDGTARTNTATATLFGIGYPSDAVDVDFTGATVTDVDDCITVTDDNATPDDITDDFTFAPDPVCLDDLDVNGEYEFGPFSTDVGPFTVEDCESIEITNTAESLTADDEVADSADATVDVNCYLLTVAKDATTTFTRNYDWDVTKERVLGANETDGDNDLTTLTLDENQAYTLTYQIVVSTTGYTDSNWAVSGTITITNPAPIAATGVSVTDVIDHPSLADVNATVDCSADAGIQTTVNIAALSSATCSYTAALGNADARTNVATATLFGESYDSAGVPVTFDNTPDVEIDECVKVTDNNGTADIGDDVVLDASLCISELDDDGDGSATTWTFTHTIQLPGFPACGPQVLTNTVSIITVDDANDTGETHSDTFTVNIDVPCPTGCTLTQGYWKTHNVTFPGGAPPDDTWYLLGDLDGDGTSEGEGETFFLSGQTFYQVMWTAPQGNVYYNLAHQYIAAWLNTIGPEGADDSSIALAFEQATALLEAYTPTEVATWKGKTGKELRAEFIRLAGILGSFNEGLIGPGHCDDDGSSLQSASAPTLFADRRQWVSLG